jgi:GTPase SAR1 family protein
LNFLLFLGTVSFDSLQRWVEDIRAERGDNASVLIVGAKKDIAAQRFQSFLVIYSFFFY